MPRMATKSAKTAKLFYRNAEIASGGVPDVGCNPCRMPALITSSFIQPTSAKLGQNFWATLGKSSSLYGGIHALILNYFKLTV